MSHIEPAGVAETPPAQSPALQDVSSATAPSTMCVVDVEADRITWPAGNPNVMTKEDYDAYVQEVRLTGKPSKPIVVVESGDGYEGVDGEHSWRACKEAGIPVVPCEIIATDKFGVMRESFERNRRGVNNPLLLGRRFQRMLKEGHLTIRALAKELRVPESTIRTHLRYCKAADLRKRRAPQDADKKIAALTVKQVEAYLALPTKKANRLLDKPGDLEKAWEHHRGRKTKKQSETTTAAYKPGREIKRGKEQLNRSALKALEDSWAAANTTTRRAFIQAIEEDVLAFVTT
jgi:ParB-like chromosome segregation protein Spo0J